MVSKEDRKSKRSARQRPSSKTSSKLGATIKDQSGQGRIRIGEILSKEGQITSIQLDESKKIHQKTQERLSSILLSKGYIDPDTITSVLSRLYNYDALKYSDLKPNPKIIETIPYEIAKKYMAFPIATEGKGDDLTIVMTMSEPTDTEAVDNLQSDVGHSLKVCVSSENDIIQAYRDYYKISDDDYKELIQFEEEEEEEVTNIEDFGSLVSEAEERVELSQEIDMEEDELGAGAETAPIIKLVNGILSKAVNDGVSDIHIEPYEKSFQVRYRIDGSLYKSMNLPPAIKSAVTSRLKILARLDIAERRVPQDGRIKMRFGKTKTVDFRVSTLPTLYGEGVVLRILDQSALSVDLSKLGFEQNTFSSLKRCINRPYGLILVTGPTGSGKTTTLYSVLNRLNKEDTKILTAEDPVEFNFKGINQVHVKEDVGMTFARALRSFLRQDPDIVMVGEIRDYETAEICLKAAMTGHLVFSTLHTNDSPSTIGRLVDIGIPSYMLSGTVTMVLSQRLGRRLCPHCKQIVTGYDPKELEHHGFTRKEIPDLELYGPKGCKNCNGTGYKGRVGFYELMEVTDEVSKAINANVPEDQLRKVAIREGMSTLREAALEKARLGVTSFEEVQKKTVVTKEALPAYLINPDVEQYEDGDYIIREGNNDIDFFKLDQGALDVVKDGKKIAEIIEPGVYFGEVAALINEPRTASIISNGRSRVTRYPGDKLAEVISDYPDVAKHLFEVTAGRLHDTNNKLANHIGKELKLTPQVNRASASVPKASLNIKANPESVIKPTQPPTTSSAVRPNESTPRPAQQSPVSRSGQPALQRPAPRPAQPNPAGKPGQPAPPRPALRPVQPNPAPRPAQPNPAGKPGQPAPPRPALRPVQPNPAPRPAQPNPASQQAPQPKPILKPAPRPEQPKPADQTQQVKHLS
ncbi:MAG: type IV-A pilus assembly ATPase PilB [Desulfobacterales bacterium]|nr:type IV-A pilus assembly ATPase PilB [Desulfobacterales bacterium]